MNKDNVKRLVGIGLGAAVLFVLAPLILAQTSDVVRANGTVFLLFMLDPAFMFIVGWQANHFPKLGVYLPAAAIVIYLVSELLIYGQITWSMELNLMEAGYIAYFLIKLLRRRKAIENKQNNKSFPKGVGRK